MKEKPISVLKMAQKKGTMTLTEVQVTVADETFDLQKGTYVTQVRQNT